jgi:hypothetical protein
MNITINKQYNLSKNKQVSCKITKTTIYFYNESMIFFEMFLAFRTQIQYRKK